MLLGCRRMTLTECFLLKFILLSDFPSEFCFESFGVEGWQNFENRSHAALNASTRRHERCDALDIFLLLFIELSSCAKRNNACFYMISKHDALLLVSF